MDGKKFLIAALSSTLLIGAAATTSFAAPGNDHGGPMHGRAGWHRPGLPPEVLYVRMVKQFDTNGDLKVSKDELKAGVDKIYDQIDANHDGEITPAELRTYRRDRIKAWIDAHKTDAAQAGTANGDNQQQASNSGNNGPRHHGWNGHGPRGAWMRQARMIQQVVLFNRIDKDGNGQISKQEAEDAANRLFDRLDRNHDGVVSIDDMPARPFL